MLSLFLNKNENDGRKEKGSKQRITCTNKQVFLAASRGQNVPSAVIPTPIRRTVHVIPLTNQKDSACCGIYDMEVRIGTWTEIILFNS